MDYTTLMDSVRDAVVSGHEVGLAEFYARTLVRLVVGWTWSAVGLLVGLGLLYVAWRNRDDEYDEWSVPVALVFGSVVSFFSGVHAVVTSRLLAKLASPNLSFLEYLTK